ncbi:potassium channel family protein [Rhodohalobacter mucosus]|uniref:RCK C-terminal domain-containing protein n=1 Tax=Rhodohalobacter mucosus TaxID=2079485 RepID=A0A316TQ49_9BACT|nr:TrkA family potassium uptake protein [Rhodohalobacter mucosus]PWN06520.1 hypothetical protein DDZ15_08335 [Rhodohalobacter mucosus]
MPAETTPQIAVIGLGVFGMALVKTLAKEGANVIAIDKDMNRLNEIKDITSNAISFDSTDSEQLKSHGITQADIAVIAIGEDFEPVVLISMELINAGVPQVYARANSATQEQILTKIGVTEIIHPERQVAEKMGVSLHRKGIEDLLELEEGLTVMEMDVPESMTNHTLQELNLRKRYGINVLIIKRPDDEQPDEDAETRYRPLGIPDGETRLEKGDKFIILGKKEDSQKMIDIN